MNHHHQQQLKIPPFTWLLKTHHQNHTHYDNDDDPLNLNFYLVFSKITLKFLRWIFDPLMMMTCLIFIWGGYLTLRGFVVAVVLSEVVTPK
jgi:hypothetical protein